VIGGGPAGSRTAFRLAAAGHKVLVLEKKTCLGEPVCCTGIISPECIHAFQISGSVILRSLNSARIFSPGGRSLHVQRPQTQACVVDRGAFDRTLAEQAIQAGAEFLLDFTVENLHLDNDSIRIDGLFRKEKFSVAARSVVIAGGFGNKSPAYPGKFQISDFTIGVQAEVTVDSIDEVEVYFSNRFAPDFFAWLVPTSPGKALAGLMSRRNTGTCLKLYLDFLKEHGKIKAMEKKPEYRPIPLRPLPRVSGRRFLVAGSAAGQVKPLTGGGIYYGMLCADLAAETLHAALEKDDLSGRSLSTYSKNYRSRLGKEVSTSYWGRQIYEHFNDQNIDKLFEIAQSNGIVASLLESDEVTFDWHGQTVKKLIREKALTGIWDIIKSPLSRIGTN